MKQKFAFLIVSILLCLSTPLTAALTTGGTEFWLTFMSNYHSTAPNAGMQLKLIVFSYQSGSVTVRNPQTNWSKTVSVTANQIGEMVVPNEQAYTYSAETVENHGLQVTATVPVTLYASNYYKYTYDATIVLPTTALGKDYIIQTYENELYSKEFCVVATADNTALSITPHARTTKGHAKNEVFTVTLKKGQTYQVMSSDSNNDFSGSQIHASAPVAVFAGHQCANVPMNNTACDHIVEQSIPVEQWGTHFALTQTKGQNGDYVSVTARYDNTEVKMNGVKQTTLNALQTWEYHLTDNSAFVETSQPAACYMYLEGATANNNMGDPSSVHISPVEQRIREITFATFQTNVSRSHYVNVVTTQAGANAMTLDGVAISADFAPLTGNASLYFAQIPISHGTHTLRTSADGFVGHVYGLGWCESYAYSFGSATINLDGDILVNGEPHSETDDGIQRCYLASIVFSPQTNTDYTSVKWDFGDGTTSTQPTVTHTYTSPKDYKVAMMVEGEDGKDTTFTILHLEETLHDTIHATLCKGEDFHLGTKTFSTSGTYDVTFTSATGCDSVVTLVLNVLPTYQTETRKTIVTGTSFRWNYKWYNKAGTYKDTLTSVNGCDSIIVLHLDLVDQTEDMYDTICYRPTYTFKDFDYTLPSIQDYKGQNYVDYTIEYRDMETCTTYRMHLAVIPQESGEHITLNDTILAGATYDFFGQLLVEPGTYTTTAEGACGCSFNYTLHLVVLPMPIHDVTACLCHEDSYTYLGKTYTKPGQYMDTIWNDAGIESIERLTLTDNRSVTTINQSNVSSYSFNGKTLTQTGTYSDTLTSANGCDSIVVLHLGIKEKCEVYSEEYKRICPGSSYWWNGMNLTLPNTYTASFTTAGGCDSTAILHLEVKGSQSVRIHHEINEGEYYKWNGVKYSESGIYTQQFISDAGCDSTVTLELIVHSNYNITDDMAICQNELPFSWEDTTWEAGSKAGDYTVVRPLHSVNGCDSIVTFTLHIWPGVVIEKNQTDSLCYSYGSWTWNNGSTDSIITDFTVGLNTRTYTKKNILGCDSVTYSLAVTVWPDKVITDQKETICDNYGSYIWHINNRDSVITDFNTGSNVRQYKVYNILGCDSLIYNLDVFVNPTYEVEDAAVTLSAGDPFDWNDVYIASVTTADSKTYTYKGKTASGCDSIVTLHLEIVPIKLYTLTASATEGGITTGGGQFGYGTSVTISAIATDPCYSFVKWSDEVTENPRNIIVTQDLELTAIFEAKTYTTLPVVERYSWLLMLNMKTIHEMGYDFEEDAVRWYRVQGEPDDVNQPISDDELICNGYSLTIDRNSAGTGSYYAVVDLPSSQENYENLCEGKMRSEIITVENPIPDVPKVYLSPTLAEANSPLLVSGLVPEETTIIRIFSATGQLLQEYRSQQQSEYTVRAFPLSGCYYMHIENTHQIATLPYIVK